MAGCGGQPAQSEEPAQVSAVQSAAESDGPSEEETSAPTTVTELLRVDSDKDQSEFLPGVFPAIEVVEELADITPTPRPVGQELPYRIVNEKYLVQVGEDDGASVVIERRDDDSSQLVLGLGDAPGAQIFALGFKGSDTLIIIHGGVTTGESVIRASTYQINTGALRDIELPAGRVPIGGFAGLLSYDGRAYMLLDNERRLGKAIVVEVMDRGVKEIAALDGVRPRLLSATPGHLTIQLAPLRHNLPGCTQAVTIDVARPHSIATIGGGRLCNMQAGAVIDGWEIFGVATPGTDSTLLYVLGPGGQRYFLGEAANSQMAACHHSIYWMARAKQDNALSLHTWKVGGKKVKQIIGPTPQAEGELSACTGESFAYAVASGTGEAELFIIDEKGAH